MPDMAGEIGRVTRSHAEAQRAYDGMSRWYDAVEGWWEKPVRAAGVALLNPGRGETILEIGCGTAQAMLAIAAAVGPAGRAIGVDLSPGMLHVAQCTLQQADAAAPTRLVCADAVQLPLAGHSVDAVFMCFTLELFDTPEIPVVLGECRRVLTSGGRLCVASLSRVSQRGLSRVSQRGLSRVSQRGLSKSGGGTLVRLYEWAHERWPAQVDCRPIYVRSAVEQAGLRVMTERGLSLWGLPVEIVLATAPAGRSRYRPR